LEITKKKTIGMRESESKKRFLISFSHSKSKSCTRLSSRTVPKFLSDKRENINVFFYYFSRICLRPNPFYFEFLKRILILFVPK